MANQPNQPNRKSEKIRRANRIIQTRTFVVMLVMGLGVFMLVFAKLFELQILRHEELQNKALDQQTRSTEITASRGTIYDRGGNILAISATAETIFLSPLELAEELKEEDTTWTAFTRRWSAPTPNTRCSSCGRRKRWPTRSVPF